MDGSRWAGSKGLEVVSVPSTFTTDVVSAAGKVRTIAELAGNALYVPTVRTGGIPLRHTEHTVTVQAPTDVGWDILVDAAVERNSVADLGTVKAAKVKTAQVKAVKEVTEKTAAERGRSA
jgi:hypothetical protein